MTLPTTETLELSLDNGVLTIALNRPEARNAMSSLMLEELMAAMDAVADDRSVRAIVIRGNGGHFCAGGDIKDMARIRQAAKVEGSDPAADYNRQFGRMLTKMDHAPQAVITLLEGAVLGGGFGLACISDIAIAKQDAKFGLPETGLGIAPAQIAPFVVKRIGITQARRLGVCGGRFNGDEALRLGMVHFAEADTAGVQARLDETLQQIRRCAPNANAVTKQIMLSVGQKEHEALLDWAAEEFSACLDNEGPEGTMAFIQKRLPAWAE